MISVLHFVDPDVDQGVDADLGAGVDTGADSAGKVTGRFLDSATAALSALAARPGYLRGSLARSTDDAAAWLLVTEWENVGSLRRALGNYEVKLHTTPLLAQALDLPTAFEQLVEIAPGGGAVVRASDREPDRSGTPDG